MSYFYRLYGVVLYSSSPLPSLDCLPPEPVKPDLHLSLGREPSWVSAARELPSQVIYHFPPDQSGDPAFTISAAGADGFFLDYSDGTEVFLDRDATRVWGRWQSPWTLEDFMTYFLGPVMGFVLRRRHVLCLHASGAVISGRAVLVCGESGTGKSTLAAALALRGNPILCEDIAALRRDAGEFCVAPAYPRVCLWPESLSIFSEGQRELPLITPNWNKRYLPLDGKHAIFQSSPLPVAAIYVLDPREDSPTCPRVVDVRAQDALPLLVKNTYMNYLLDREQRATEFEQLAALVAQVPVRRIVPHSHLERVQTLCDVLTADAEKIIGFSTAAAGA